MERSRILGAEKTRGLPQSAQRTRRRRLRREDLIEELIDRAMGLEDGEAMVHGASKVGVGESDATKGSTAQCFSRGGLAIFAEEEAGLGVEISVAPAV